MTATPPEILGALRAADGLGVVRIDVRFGAGIDDVWAACTDERQLAQWYGPVEGDLRPGGSIRIHVVADGRYGTGQVEACAPRRRLRLTTRESDESGQEGEGVAPFEETIDVTLEAAGPETSARVEVSGIPLDVVAFYGVGWHLHAERLATYLAGRVAADTEDRWPALLPRYQEMAARLT